MLIRQAGSGAGYDPPRIPAARAYYIILSEFNVNYRAYITVDLVKSCQRLNIGR